MLLKKYYFLHFESHPEIYYKMTKGKLYVIIKGNPRVRTILTGTRYVNANPKIVKLGLSKVDFPRAFRGAAVVALVFYGLAKTVEGVSMYLEDGEIRSDFFLDIPAEVTKLLLSSLAAAGAALFFTTIGFPVALAAAGALVVGFGASVLLDKFDEKIGFTKAVRETTEKLTMNMKQEWERHKNTLSVDTAKAVERARAAAIQMILAKAKREAAKAFNFDSFPLPRSPGFPLPRSPSFPKELPNPLEGLEQLFRTAHHIFRTAHHTIQTFNNIVSYKWNIF